MKSSKTKPACKIMRGINTMSILLLAYKKPFIIKQIKGQNIEIIIINDSKRVFFLYRPHIIKIQIRYVNPQP